MKIWFDILTPKQLLFFEPMIKNLQKKHTILCTSRDYQEFTNLAKVRRFKSKSVGKFGGGQKYGKLKASLERMTELLKIVTKFKPDLTISFYSPDAARISHGLGIYHIAFTDAPHATAIVKLTVPLLQKLLIPWVIPKKEFMQHGIASKNIIPYRALDAALTLKRTAMKDKELPFDPKSKKTILIRVEEHQASYSVNKSDPDEIVKHIIKHFKGENIIVLTRFANQMKKDFGDKATVLTMSYDGKLLLNNCDAFVGSGGSMTIESALMGIPTISYNAIPNIMEKYVVSKKLAFRQEDPKKIPLAIKRVLKMQPILQKRAKKELDKMTDPFDKLLPLINALEKK